GREQLAAWLAQVDEDPDGGPGEFILKVFLGFAGPPGAALAQLQAYRRLLQRRLAHYEDMDRNLSPDEPVHSRIALHHRIARAHAGRGGRGRADAARRRGARVRRAALLLALLPLAGCGGGSSQPTHTARAAPKVDGCVAARAVTLSTKATGAILGHATRGVV